MGSLTLMCTVGKLATHGCKSTEFQPTHSPAGTTFVVFKTGNSFRWLRARQAPPERAIHHAQPNMSVPSRYHFPAVLPLEEVPAPADGTYPDDTVGLSLAPF